MTPLEAIIKNVILIAVLVYLYRLIDYEDGKKWALLIPSLVVPFAAVFLLFPLKHYQIVTGNEKNNPPKPQTPVIVNQKQANKVNADIPVKKRDTTVIHAIKENEKLPVAVFKDFSGGVTADFTKGKEIVCVLNVECEDCIETAKAIGALNKEMNLPPVYFLLLGDEKQLPEFFGKTKTNYPYKLLNEEEFFTLIKGSPPRVWLLQNGKIAGDWNFRNFSIDNFKAAVKKIQK
jgi:hypothetical protein